MRMVRRRMRRLAGDCFSGRAPIYSQLPTIPRGEETTCHPLHNIRDNNVQCAWLGEGKEGFYSFNTSLRCIQYFA